MDETGGIRTEIRDGLDPLGHFGVDPLEYVVLRLVRPAQRRLALVRDVLQIHQKSQL